MDCEHIRPRLVGYIDNDLRVTERLCVDVHLAQCDHCKDELLELRDFMGMMDKTLRHPRPVCRFEDIRHRLDEVELLPHIEGVRPRFGFRDYLNRVAAAAVFVCMVGTTGPFVQGMLSAALRFEDYRPSSELVEMSTLPEKPVWSPYVVYVEPKSDSLVDRGDASMHSSASGERGDGLGDE